MARSITTRLELTGILRVLTPLHVGGYGTSAEADLPLACNGAGRWYVPGTSLAGALRDWCLRAFGESDTDAIWGYQNPKKENEDDGQASHVMVADTVIPENVVVEVRDGVGIDRQWGGAADRFKYDRAVLPRGALLELRLSVDRTGPDDRALEMFESLKAALERGVIRLGAAKTRGLGSVRLEQAHLKEHEFNTKRGILAYLRGDKVEDLRPTTTPRLAGPSLRVTIDWQPIGPFMVKAGADGIGVDMLPLTGGREGGLSLVLPGSSVKGVLRAHAERIVRTVGNFSCGDGFLEQIEARRDDDPTPSLIEMLFGSPGRKDKTKANQPIARLGLGALGVDDCYGKQAISDEHWRRIKQASPDATPETPKSPMLQSLHDADLKAWSAAYHVAIDRWTGGAAESFLYTVLEPTGTTWEPLRMHVNLSRLEAQEHDPALALLLLVLRDLAAGQVPLGFATHRGMGAVQVKSIRIEADGDCGEELREPILLDRSFTLPEKLESKLQNAWEQWSKGSRQAEVKS